MVLNTAVGSSVSGEMQDTSVVREREIKSRDWSRESCEKSETEKSRKVEIIKFAKGIWCVEIIAEGETAAV